MPSDFLVRFDRAVSLQSSRTDDAARSPGHPGCLFPFPCAAARGRRMGMIRLRNITFQPGNALLRNRDDDLAP
jgi:hypothetical protein